MWSLVKKKSSEMDLSLDRPLFYLERESQAASVRCVEAIIGLDLIVLRSQPERKWSLPALN